MTAQASDESSTNLPVNEKAAAEDFRAAAGRGWRAAIGYEILLKMLGAAALAPLAAWLLAGLLSFSGRIAISNAEMLAFLQSPTGLVAVSLIASALTLTMLVEQAGLMWIAHRSLQNSRPTMLAALLRVLNRGVALIQLALLLTIAVTLCTLPFAAICGAAYFSLLTAHDINFYFDQRPPAFWAAVAIGGVCAALLGIIYTVLYVRWIFALPACVVSNLPARAALATSWRLTRGNFWRLALLLGGFSGAMMATASAIDFGMRQFEQWAIHTAGENLQVALPTVAGVLTLDILVISVVSFFVATLFCLLVTLLYHRAAVAAGKADLIEQAAYEPASAEKPIAPFRKRRIVYGAAIVFLLVSTSLAYAVVETLAEVHPVKITAHRGSSRGAPENTLSAVRLAIEQGVDFTEIDVQETADGQVVVLHDSDLQRVTGQPGNIWEVDYARLAQLDAGSWFSPDFREERIPKLSELLAVTGERIGVNIELKFNGHDQDLAARVLQIVRAAGVAEHCILTSSKYQALLDAQEIDPTIPTGLIVFESAGDITSLEVDLLSLNQKTVTRQLVETAHRHGKQVHVWTVNDPRRMKELILLGVDNLITDAPVEALAVRQELAELSDLERVLLLLQSMMSGNRR